MYDPSFNSESFQEIFDKENRKGKNIEGKFQEDFKNSLELLHELKETNGSLRDEGRLERRVELYERKKDLKIQREKAIRDVLETTASKVSKKKEISLTRGLVYGKESYQLENTIEDFFISKKVQLNLRKSYNVKQANRYSLLSELTNLLEDGFPKYVIRTDIKSFYESIPQKMLREKINRDHLLTVKTKQFINNTLDSYNKLTNQGNLESAKGVPRGVGFSAYLSELFMRKIDNKLKKIPDLIYYARYVDDIIMLFVPKAKNVPRSYLDNYKTQLIQIIKDESLDFLQLNPKKTEVFNLLSDMRDIDFGRARPKIISFLGYRFGSNNNELKIYLSINKLNKYKRKIRLSFEDFKNKKRHNRKEAFKLLSARINYLASNTKLRNNKDKVFVGIFYSNPFLNCDESLMELQRYLNWYVIRAGFNRKEIDTLAKVNFINNFHAKRFVLLPIKKKLYKNHNAKNSDNNGIVQYGLSEINSIWKK